MSHKRPRSTFEADVHAPFATFGTPLPDEADARDDGSYLPLWKQDVRDERGRKRLHGAFTGGWSAGYFNSVGSKEGWAPSTFVSSRSNRRKNDNAAAPHRAEDYMDEEDLADAAEAQKLQTSQAFAGLGASTGDGPRSGSLTGLLKVEGDTMGLKLLRRMGWKDGQGIGLKVRRGARLDVGKVAQGSSTETYTFAPDNTPMIRFVRKTDRKGLGHRGETKLSDLGREGAAGDDDGEDEEPHTSRWGKGSQIPATKPKPKSERGGIGVGILNDNGSDEEDPYEIGPKIRYGRVVGGDRKKKKKKKAAAVNPSLTNAPVFVPKTARAGNSFRRCHDGRLPLDGFVLAKMTEDLTVLLSKYIPPPIPSDWTSARDPSSRADKPAYMSTSEAAKTSGHDAKSRAAILGEKALPGKSVFDFLSSSVRDKVAAASGNKNLPPAKGEMPEGYEQSEEDRQKALWDQVPTLDRDTAAAAISRSEGGPYADNEAKKARYRAYLEWQANPEQQSRPMKTKGLAEKDFLKEMTEFHNCARIFKPMTGFMGSRFTTAKTVSSLAAHEHVGSEMASRPGSLVADTAEEAAKVGMFGKMTRSVEIFVPTRLLCKRFNVKAPAHSQPDHEPGIGGRTAGESWPVPSHHGERANAPAPVSSAGVATDDADGPDTSSTTKAIGNLPPNAPAEALERVAAVNPETNVAVEGGAANANVLRAIFGDSDDE